MSPCFYLLKSDHVPWMPASNLLDGHYRRTQLPRRSPGPAEVGWASAGSAINAEQVGIAAICSMGFGRVVSRGTFEVPLHLPVDTRRLRRADFMSSTARAI